jgi:hypothetical protein
MIKVIKNIENWERDMCEEEFVTFYFSQFGYDCGSPRAIADSLGSETFTYLGRGFTAKKIVEASKQEENTNQCRHPNKYLNILTKNLQFMVCPDCKKEVT